MTRSSRTVGRPSSSIWGANNGASALWFRSTYPAAHIVAVEPESSNVRVLRDNTERSRVAVIEAAIGSRSGSVDIADHGHEWGFRTTRSDTGTTPIVTIDDIVTGCPNSDLFIVKVDIEGFENDLFSEHLEWLDDVFVVMIEPHDWMLPGSRSSAAFQEAFGQRDFDILLRGENIVYVRR
ncbi:MAG: FkbM family methyltransferase [Ilumatobacter sp.]|uniref:FkbM family methyltransferase n=1 Tax=Ilumatobacter sp. TaxID=1967498 RepID=UPI003299B719